MTAPTGLTRVTVNAPHRRLDVALPDHAPLAELLPELLRQAGSGLADVGQAHGGWVLRRIDGVALTVGAGLHTQGVRDGAVLHLVPARTSWPELEYDDVVEAIAGAARRHGRGWDGAATRVTALAVAGLAALLGAVALLRTPEPSGFVALGAAAVLLLAGVLASRAYGDGVAGTALAGYALPFAALGGLGLLDDGGGRFTAAHLLLAGVAVLLVAALGALGVGRTLSLFVAATVVGLAGVLGAVAATWATPAGAAAVVLAVLVTGVLAVPVLAVRLGELPVPVPTPVLPGREEPPHPGRDAIFAAVVRADQLLTGGLIGVAAGAACADIWLARSGGVGGRVLVGVAGGALLLRARVFPALRHRLPLLLSGVAAGALLLSAVPLTGRVAGPALLAGLVLAALALAFVSAAYQRREPGPYLGRAADILDALCVLSVLPAACAVLGLYGRMRGIAG
jgi:type VII secretion integral membrane protein EccD